MTTITSKLKQSIKSVNWPKIRYIFSKLAVGFTLTLTAYILKKFGLTKPYELIISTLNETSLLPFFVSLFVIFLPIHDGISSKLYHTIQTTLLTAIGAHLACLALLAIYKSDEIVSTLVSAALCLFSIIFLHFLRAEFAGKSNKNSFLSLRIAAIGSFGLLIWIYS